MPAIVTFDGPNRLIQEISAGGDNTLDAVEIASEWFDWFTTSDNTKFLPAFEVLGAEPLGGGRFRGTSFKLLNGWKIQPAALDHRLVIDGTIFAEDGSSIFELVAGSFQVQTEVIVAIDAIGLTATADQELLQRIFLAADRAASQRLVNG
jgi:hypothetical protein